MVSFEESNQKASKEQGFSPLDSIAGFIRKSIMLGSLVVGTAYSVSSHTGNLIARTADALERHEAGEDDKF